MATSIRTTGAAPPHGTTACGSLNLDAHLILLQTALLAGRQEVGTVLVAELSSCFQLAARAKRGHRENVLPEIKCQ
jgi:hypothetical protein